MDRLKHLLPELRDESDDVDVQTLLPRIFKTLEKNGTEKIRKHRSRVKPNFNPVGFSEKISSEEVWLKDALKTLSVNNREIGRRERVRTRTLRKVAKVQRKKNR